MLDHDGVPILVGGQNPVCQRTEPVVIRPAEGKHVRLGQGPQPPQKILAVLFRRLPLDPGPPSDRLGYRQQIPDPMLEFAEQDIPGQVALNALGGVNQRQQERTACVSRRSQRSPRARDLGLPFPGTPGPLNAITDIPGLAVGFCTLTDPAREMRTGVTEGSVGGGNGMIAYEFKAGTGTS